MKTRNEPSTPVQVARVLAFGPVKKQRITALDIVVVTVLTLALVIALLGTLIAG